jgi:hypothetical protein
MHLHDAHLSSESPILQTEATIFLLLCPSVAFVMFQVSITPYLDLMASLTKLSLSFKALHSFLDVCCLPCRLGPASTLNAWIKASSPHQDFLFDLAPAAFAPLHFASSAISLQTGLSILSSDNPAQLRIARIVRINLNSHTSNLRLPRSHLPTY